MPFFILLKKRVVVNSLRLCRCIYIVIQKIFNESLTEEDGGRSPYSPGAVFFWRGQSVEQKENNMISEIDKN